MLRNTSPLFGIYIHWPFCVSKCPYCDFNSHVREKIDSQKWEDAYLKEIKNMAAISSQKTVTSIFFGGGTPSLMDPLLVEKIIKAIKEAWLFGPHLEVTLEANPGSVEAEKFEAFKNAGINRVSLGIQSFHDDALSFLGRKHSRQEGINALKIAQKTFDRFSFDLIYTLPNQSLAAWEKELSHAIDTFEAKHLSLYQLTIERQTPFEQLYRAGKIEMPEENLSALFYESTESIMQKKGLFSYEVSNYASPGEECLHNYTYWKYEDYIGIGPGAHGRLEEKGVKYAFTSHRSPEEWLKRIDEYGTGVNRKIPLSPQERLKEYFLMNMRLKEGVHKDHLEKSLSLPFDTLFTKNKQNALIQEGLLQQMGDTFSLTFEGRLKLNAVLRFLVGD